MQTNFHETCTFVCFVLESFWWEDGGCQQWLKRSCTSAWKGGRTLKKERCFQEFQRIYHQIWSEPWGLDVCVRTKEVGLSFAHEYERLKIGDCVENTDSKSVTHSLHLSCQGPSLYAHLRWARSWWRRAVCPHCETGSDKATVNSSVCPNWRHDSRAYRERFTCSISSQSSLPTKIISLGRRWRVPPLLTRNQEVRLISASRLHFAPLAHRADRPSVFSQDVVNEAFLWKRGWKHDDFTTCCFGMLHFRQQVF